MSRLLAAFVDDAGLFPPTALPMGEALARHRRDLAGGDPMLTHRFLCPVGRIDELRAGLADTDRIALVLVAPAGTPGGALTSAAATVDADPRLRLAVVEFACAPDDLDAALPAATALAAPVFVEAPDRADTPRLAAALAGRGAGLKIRCGGVRAALFPRPDEVAGALVAAAAAGVPVKATAGLHHAVRHRDPITGFTHHGFLNLVLAAARTAAGAAPGAVAAAMASTDGPALAAEALNLPPDGAAATRRLLRAYGSCSTATPTAEAAALGLAPAPLTEGQRT
ncbi:Uncharacterised protein (plasmid) [Tsukamurella tyrosinosolvens]|uniref:Hydroxymethylglutaryl-CoA lyase n=1 Tax=Tsukamurella tyrosinosolvens TaxID=57704 RepID=A0A1H5C042_TSUTY|nr:hypothetical protein [Tsukamurella tyrosinosolvens]KXO92638.1 hypothetical protein AXK58_18695 [Tsukamurella tyrosinosolvens]SED59928.1 hypothetical protein SAMN04489793_5263 [Tsukamurella tyrosinosolvens]VEI01788.1 Uncharacterised protein [Tsukamurella tyrosinosolvens]